jgi:hypothetical protein
MNNIFSNLKNVLAYYKAGIVVDLEVAGLAPRRN